MCDKEGLEKDDIEILMTMTKRTHTLWKNVSCLLFDVIIVSLFISLDDVSTSEYRAEDWSGVNTINLICLLELLSVASINSFSFESDTEMNSRNVKTFGI